MGKRSSATQQLLSKTNITALPTSATAAIALYCLFLLTTPSHFHTNDDVLMSAFLNGDYSTSNSGLIFIGPILEGLLRVLYALPLSVAWYGLVLHYFNMISIFLIADFFDRIFHLKGLNKLGLFILSSLLSFYLINNVTFTITAALLALAAYTYFFAEECGVSSTRLLPLILLVLSASLRFHSAVLISIIALIIRVSHLLRTLLKNRFQNLSKYVKLRPQIRFFLSFPVIFVVGEILR